MRIEVRYYGALRDQAGTGSEPVESEAQTVAELYRELAAQGRVLLPERLVKFVFEGEFVSGDTPLSEGIQVEFLPPAAGG